MASNIRATTQQHIDVEDVLDNIVIQKDGSCAMVLKTNALNFGLLSEEEQDATIYAYAAFLNSLTFSVQILIRSDLKDISGYLRLLEEQEIKQTNPIKKQQISYYKNFVSALITERNVLEKSFYLVVPFSPLELGVTQSFSSAFLKSKTTLPFEKSYILEKAKASLEPKRDHLLSQLARIGLSARQLSTQELIQLFFSMYNASSTQGQKITNTNDYTVPLVQPAYIKPKEEFMSDQSQTPSSMPPQTDVLPPTPTMTPPPQMVSDPVSTPQATPPTLTVPQEPMTQIAAPSISQPTVPNPDVMAPLSKPLTPAAPSLPQAPVAPTFPNMPPVTASLPTPPVMTPTPLEIAKPTPPVMSMPTIPTTPAAPTVPSLSVNKSDEVNPLDAQDAINSAASDLTNTGA